MDLKEKVQQFVEIAKACPENLRETCFRLLLENYLSGAKTSPPRSGEQKYGTPETAPPKPLAESTKAQGDINASDLHVKVKRFMEKNGVTLDDLNSVFYKEDDHFLPLFDTLGTTKTSESQIRVTLLRCLQNALATGEFECAWEEVREECRQRKCYDGSNFRNNFVNNARLFADKFTKDVKTVKLSDQGKQELADVVKELK